MLSWIFGKSEQRVERAQLGDMISFAWKRLRQDGDIIPEKRAKEFGCEIQKAQNALTANEPELKKTGERLADAYQRSFPPQSYPSWRENGDVILVALVVAMAVRAFFLQPFKIPTGSMQPTLNGIIVRAATPQDNTWWNRAISRPIFGERVFRFVAESDCAADSVRVRAVKFPPLHYGGSHGFFNIFPSEATEISAGSATYTLPVELAKFQQDMHFFPSQPFRKGDVILNCVIQTGDQLFVDRFTYNFRKPARGDVFVFETKDIISEQMTHRGDFFIKRLAGVPGDTLRIEEGDLYINGSVVKTPPGFLRVMSMQDGYHGYANRGSLGDAKQAVTMQKLEYFALGDNSYNSLDSRYWGPVPYHAIVGRGFFVYWPFTRHYGRVE